jgi:hypothetical protein
LPAKALDKTKKIANAGVGHAVPFPTSVVYGYTCIII